MHAEEPSPMPEYSKDPARLLHADASLVHREEIQRTLNLVYLLVLILGAAACNPDPARRPPGTIQRGKTLPMSLSRVPLEWPAGFRATGGRGRIVIHGERNTGHCPGRKEREVYRAARDADIIVLWLRRKEGWPRGDCAGVGLMFRYRATIDSVPSGVYRLSVVEQDDEGWRNPGPARTVFRTRVSVE